MGGDSGRITVRERIDPEITATLFANYRSSADALMELVDNALDSRLPGEPMKVDLAFHGEAVTVMSEGGEARCTALIFGIFDGSKASSTRAFCRLPSKYL